MNRDDICDKFLDTLAFDPYPFQEEAILAWYEESGGILVTAPTGMGKTLIAESAIFEALSSRTRLYYTTPLIALTDQKFREFQGRAQEWGFPADDVGLITGNRRVNPDAPVRVVVAEILLNHLLTGEEMFEDVSGVVMDEFHYFNDFDRGIVWELSLALLPPHVRLLLLSATVGNALEFTAWLREKHGRKVKLVRTDERRVPLEFTWVEDKLLAEQLPAMMSDTDEENRTPALVFCFHRDECWEVAERLKGIKMTHPATRARIEELMPAEDFIEGAGRKLRQMLICGAGVHHAGILPKHKEVVEQLFLEKLIPFVVCTETLAAGINLPARSVVVTTLLKGPRGQKKLIQPSSAHQMFGRAGRPQFDSKGYVYALAHEDDIKIAKWRKKYEQIDAKSKDPGVMRARKDLERKKPSRRKTEQYWTEGQFRTLIQAGPAGLASRSMIPYQFLIYLLHEHGSLAEVRGFLHKRFAPPEEIEKFQKQLDYMIGNLQTFGYLERAADGDHVTVHDHIKELLRFRSVDPLYAAFITPLLSRGAPQEKLQVLESLLPMPPALRRRVELPDYVEIGPLEEQEIVPELIQLGIITAQVKRSEEERETDSISDWWDDEEEREPANLPEMLKALFDAKLSSPEDVFVQPKWVAGGIAELEDDFYKYCRDRHLVKNEGLVLRHLLRLTILAGEFAGHSDGDPAYEEIAGLCTRICQRVDPRYTDRFLASEAEARSLMQL